MAIVAVATPRLVSVPPLGHVPPADHPRCLEVHKMWEVALEAEPVDTLMAVVTRSGALARHHAAHLIDRYVRKYRVAEPAWLKILLRCNLRPVDLKAADGSYNLLLLGDADLRRLYFDAPGHHASIGQEESRAAVAAAPKVSYGTLEEDEL